MVTAHREDGQNDLGTSARSMVIPGNGNILMLIHPRGHSALVSEIGNVLRHDVTEAALSCESRGLLPGGWLPALFLSRYTGSCCTVRAGLARVVSAKGP